MIFSSSIFIFGFLPIVLALYYNPFVKRLKFRNIILLIASLFFYAWGEPLFVFLMVFSVYVNWKIGLLIDKNWEKRKKYLIIATIYNIALLFVFKYLTFVTENIAWISGNESVIVDIALPIGISFFTFQMMSYVFDIVMQTAQPQKKFTHVLLYVSLFPQLIAGPIVRYETIEQELGYRNENFTEFSEGLCRFVKGLCKKVLLSNTIAILADTVFGYELNTLSVASAWLGIIAYTLQIYYDFSGYSDMAIGLGLMFGFHFKENFDHPYSSKTVTEFWRRWHISMGSWFRDYVYIPLGGNRVSKVRHIVNLFIVWSLTGLWHGANWTFIFWGLFYFVILVFEKFTKLGKRINWLGHIYTMLLVMIGWVFFRSESIGAALSYLSVMFGVSGNILFDNVFRSLASQFYLLLIIGSILSVLKIKLPKTKASQIISTVAYVIGFLVVITFVVKGGYNPFIYFNF